MQRNALVSAFCVLLITNIPVAANSNDIEALIGKCARSDHKACRKLAARRREPHRPSVVGEDRCRGQ